MSDPAEVLVPQTNPNDEHAVLVAWLVQKGARVAAEQPLATLETTKATFDVHAPRDGVVFYDQEERSMVEVGAAIAWITDGEEPPAAAAAPRPQPAPPTADGGQGRFTRKALRAMQASGLVEADFPGGGRIDVATVEKLVAARSHSPTEAARRPAVGALDGALPLEQSPTKMLEARMLAEVYRSIVPSAVVVALDRVRVAARIRDAAAEGLVATLLELSLFECARLLPDFPDLAAFHAGGRPMRHASLGIGFAVSIGNRGLRVPVVRETGTLAQVCRAVRDLTLRYMRNELVLQDLTGGAFTITDLSGTRVHQFSPVLNERQSAILGICAERPGSGHQDLVLAFDHRLTDGMRAAAFLDALVQRLGPADQ